MVAELTGGSPEIGLVIRDPAAMLAFYRDFLGLRVERERSFPGVQLWWLACGGGFIKLVHLDATASASNPPGGMREATGLRYITVHVANVEEIADAAGSGGGKLVWTNANDLLTAAMLEDPEGNQVEVVRWS